MFGLGCFGGGGPGGVPGLNLSGWGIVKGGKFGLICGGAIFGVGIGRGKFGWSLGLIGVLRSSLTIPTILLIIS